MTNLGRDSLGDMEQSIEQLERRLKLSLRPVAMDNEFVGQLRRNLVQRPRVFLEKRFPVGLLLAAGAGVVGGILSLELVRLIRQRPGPVQGKGLAA